MSKASKTPRSTAARLKDWRWLPVVVAVSLTLLTRALLLSSLAPALYSPEELFNAELATHLIEHGELLRPLNTYQYTAHAGGSLVVSILHVPFAWLIGPSESSLKCVAIFFAMATSGLWTAAACRLDRTAGWFVAMGCVVAPLHLVFRQMTALGNHAEALALMGGAVLLLQSRHFWALGALLGFGIWFDRTLALFALCCLPAVPVRDWPKLAIAAIVGASPLLLQSSTELPGASLASQFRLEPAFQLPLVPPLTGGPRWPSALAALGILGLALSQGRRDARACSLFVLAFVVAWAFYVARNWHVQTVVTLPVLFSAAALRGRWRLASSAFIWLLVGLSTLDGTSMICTENLRSQRIDGLALARAEVWWYRPAQVPELQAWLDEGAPLPEVFGRYFQYSADSPGLFTWRFFQAIGPEGQLTRDICFGDEKGLPTVEQVDAALGPLDEPSEEIAKRARRIRAL